MKARWEKSWKYAYKGIVPQDYLDNIPEGRWASHIEQTSKKNLVMIRDGMIIGTSSFGKSRMEEMDGFGEIFLFIYCRNIWERGMVDCYCRLPLTN